MATSPLAQQLRSRRLALELTLAEVADRAGLSLPYVSNLERGRGNPTMEALRSLAEALEIPMSALIGDDEAIDPTELILAEAPPSLIAYSRSPAFKKDVEQLAAEQQTDADAMRRRLLVAMASAPRRSSGEPTRDDWRRLLDAYRLILTKE